MDVGGFRQSTPPAGAFSRPLSLAPAARRGERQEPPLAFFYVLARRWEGGRRTPIMASSVRRVANSAMVRGHDLQIAAQRGRPGHTSDGEARKAMEFGRLTDGKERCSSGRGSVAECGMTRSEDEHPRIFGGPSCFRPTAPPEGRRTGRWADSGAAGGREVPAQDGPEGVPALQAGPRRRRSLAGATDPGAVKLSSRLLLHCCFR